ncbi:hypothetical protein F511_28778 [Dorcoceras hygrometricum]|uniref:Uncharacterized protein n=1 Tax=Dorcoceras hygrometricum TaxID=472368 RepID=A0A2Z7A3X3_9LAMI|nr:hypothetical protein F511_28778 [Dorcoceras hygrometricum]
MASSFYSNSQHVDFDSVLAMDDQAEVFKNLFQEARQEGRTIDDVQTLRFNEFRKNILAQNASIFTGLADVRKEVQEVNAKVDIMASRLNDVRQNVEETKESLSHQLLEFQSQAQANQNILHAQLSELVNYINRGSADKKGKSSSRGPQQPPNVQIRDSGTGGDSVVRTPTFAKRVEMVQRQIVENVLDADRNSESLERQAAAERDREIRQNVEETKESLSHQLLEFQSQAQANQNILHAQLSELVNYINRGSADKKGKSSSRGPQQPPNVQIRDSGTGGDSVVRTPTFAKRVEMVQRQIVENVLDADRNSESLERQAAAERDRERRRREARLLKRRRRF